MFNGGQRKAPLLWAAVAAALLGLAAAAALMLRGGGGPLLAPSVPEGGADYYQADARMGHAHRPDVRRRVRWPEHPDGGFVMATNAQGLREDGPVVVPRPQGLWRVLVVGDSHTDGVVPNAASFPNLLEAALSAQGAPMELLNAGTGFYGPDQYTRTLAAWGDLEPSAIIVTLYLGNDPLDTLRAREAAGQLAVPRPKGYYPRLAAAEALMGPGIAQGLNQLALFSSSPALMDAALGFTVGALSELREGCVQRDIPLLVALLPSKLVVEPADIPQLGEALAAAGLDPAAPSLEIRLREELKRRLVAEGIQTLDLSPWMRCPGAPCFWRADHHLSAAGHQAVAEALRRQAPAPILGR